MLGKGAGLSGDETIDARRGNPGDLKERAAIEFARTIAEKRGHVSDDDVDAVRNAGYDDGQIGEIIANVALNTFTNYFNHVVRVAPKQRETHHGIIALDSSGTRVVVRLLLCTGSTDPQLIISAFSLTITSVRYQQ